MKSILLLGALLCLSISASAKTKNLVPAEDLVATARTIVSQTGPGYFIQGEFSCSLINSGWSPATSTCSITINGSTAKMKKADKLINALMKLKAPTGPAYKVQGTFEASSVSSEFPPYKVSETASVVVK